MNWFDVVLILVFAASVVCGVAKGFARQVIGLAAAVAGFLCGLWFYGTAGSFLLPYVSHKGIANFLGFVGILVAFLILGALVGKLLGALLKWVGLSGLDRFLGVVFGLVRGVVVAVALVLALLAFWPPPPPRALVGSRLAPYVIDAAYACAYLAPREVRQGVEDSYAKVKEAWAQFLEEVRQEKEGRRI